MFIDFRKRGRDKERNIGVREKHRSAASYTCPDQELNPPPFDGKDSAPTI